MKNSSEKEYLSKQEINRLVNIIICQQIIGNDSKIIINKIDSDKYEIKINITKNINPRILTFINCGFTSKNSSLDYDSDFDISEENFKIIVSESTMMNFKSKIYEEGFEFLIKELNNGKDNTVSD